MPGLDDALPALRSSAQGARLGIGARAGFFALVIGLSGLVVGTYLISVEGAGLVMVIFACLATINAVWISGGAATAIMGLVAAPAQPAPPPPVGWRPSVPTALLFTICGEPPAPLAAHARALRHALDRAGLAETTTIFVLSDTSGPDLVAAEDIAMSGLRDIDGIRYRRREENAGRKPGNIADWLARHGAGFDLMMVLDADSRMSADRIRRMIWRLQTTPRLGLLQAGIRTRPGRSRFARHQRLTGRLLGPVFGNGTAAWTATDGNYWGHNALLRVAAFRHAARLPVLSGRPPFGGPVLSHDFVEAAFIRRAGWHVALEPECRGSAESAPETLDAFHRRDRRWCQGNLQHLRLVAAPGLHPISRLHLVAGVVSYLAAPIWLVLVALMISGAVVLANPWSLVIVALVLLTPPVCGLLHRVRRRARRRPGLRDLKTWAASLGLSFLLAPLVMVRQAGAVLSVLAGRDCGWAPGRKSPSRLPRGSAEALCGAGLAALAVSQGQVTPGIAPWWLAPIVLPLLLAPGLVRYLDGPA